MLLDAGSNHSNYTYVLVLRGMALKSIPSQFVTGGVPIDSIRQSVVGMLSVVIDLIYR